ncbi:hypothetical protein MRX96_008285 [Rhipicephalus microplus]
MATRRGLHATRTGGDGDVLFSLSLGMERSRNVPPEHVSRQSRHTCAPCAVRVYIPPPFLSPPPPAPDSHTRIR